MKFTRLRELILKVSALTHEGKVTWSKFKDDTYSLDLPSGTVTIGKEPGSTSEIEDYRFTIYDKEGNILESVIDVELSSQLPIETGYRSNDIAPFAEMMSLYRMAQNNFHMQDKTLDDFFNDLDNLSQD